jgi:hypothetical protein
MRRIEAIAIVAALSAVGLADDVRAAARILTLGSSLGLDVYSQEGSSSLFVFSTTPGSPFLLPVAEPGLRIGVVLPGERVELAAQVGATVIGSEGESMHALGGTLEGNYCFAGDAEVKPYAGMHVGASRLGFDGGTTGLTNVGVQFGARRMVAAGHGAVRFELRGSLLQGDGDSSLRDLGARFGYEIWFR